ncbi:hypothetical protein MTP99_001733 [Tenebrio molitor]|jgi:hypothetical protein|nr:hypothetical protein MTP99_001733 [Tenebrio molitor]
MKLFVIITLVVILISTVTVSRSMPTTVTAVSEDDAGDTLDDLDVAEVFVFRPLFVYRALQDRRARLRQ